MLSRIILFTLAALSSFVPANSSALENNNNLANGAACALERVSVRPENDLLQTSLTQDTERIALNPLFENIQTTIGYRFQNAELLILALRHSSTDKGHTLSSRGYERLEFFGDAVLEHIIRGILWYDFPHLNDGGLRKTCSRLVENNSIAKISEILRLPEISKDLGLTLPSFDAKTLHTHGKADFVESLIAAIYEDGGIEEAIFFIQKYWRSKKAPKELIAIFNELAVELKAFKTKQPAQTSQKLLTKINGQKSNDSLSFLGEGVLALTLKRFLCKHFPEASEGNLTDKYSEISSNQAIDELCKAFHLDLKSAAMKKHIGDLYVKDGLEKASRYILSYWTSLKAPQVILNVIRKKAGSNEMIFFIKPEVYSSFLIKPPKLPEGLVLKRVVEAKDNSADFQSIEAPESSNERTTTHSVSDVVPEKAQTTSNKAVGSVNASSKEKAKKVRTPQQIAERKARRELLKSKREKRRAAKLEAQKIGDDFLVKKKPRDKKEGVLVETADESLKKAPETMSIIQAEDSEKPSSLIIAAGMSNSIIPDSAAVMIPKNTRKRSKNNKADSKVEALTPLSFGFTSVPEDWKEWDK